MNREIKCKAWSKKLHKVLHVCGMDYMINLDADSVEIAFIKCAERTDDGWSNGGTYYADDVLLMVATGKKDKNGIDILGGHIVHLVDRAHGDLGVYEVEFNDDYAGFVMYNNNEIRHFVDHHSDEEIEVIGNIYENPELLEI